MMEDSPKVSFLIPTLNAAGILANCLQSIRRQEYPPEKIEIIVADGGSADATRELAAQHGARVLDNPRRGYDSGKSVALAAATGEFVVFVDADNELSHPDFLNQSIAALRRYPEALGLESYYLASPKMSSFCIYLSQLLHISDPIAWLMSVKPVRVAVDGAIERWTFPKDSFAWPMGSNGFVFRRSDLSGLSLNDKFEDCAVVARMAQAGRREWLRVTNRGVHHYVASGLADFIRKRRRQTFHFLSLRGQGATSWTQMHPAVPAWLALAPGGQSRLRNGPDLGRAHVRLDGQKPGNRSQTATASAPASVGNLARAPEGFFHLQWQVWRQRGRRRFARLSHGRSGAAGGLRRALHWRPRAERIPRQAGIQRSNCFVGSETTAALRCLDARGAIPFAIRLLSPFLRHLPAPQADSARRLCPRRHRLLVRCDSSRHLPGAPQAQFAGHGRTHTRGDPPSGPAGRNGGATALALLLGEPE